MKWFNACFGVRDFPEHRPRTKKTRNYKRFLTCFPPRYQNRHFLYGKEGHESIHEWMKRSLGLGGRFWEAADGLGSLCDKRALELLDVSFTPQNGYKSTEGREKNNMLVETRGPGLGGGFSYATSGSHAPLPIWHRAYCFRAQLTCL